MRSKVTSWTLVFCTACLLAAGSAVAQTRHVLKLNSQWPATAAVSKSTQWFADEVRKRSNGEIEIRVFWAEALGKANENLSLMQKGGIEMADMSAGYFPAQLPFFVAPNSVPMAMNTVKQANTLMRRLVTEVPALAEEAKSNGIRPLFFHHLNPYLLVSKEPLTTVDQVKGRKIRTWGTDMPRMAQAVGMTPVTLSLPEIYEGLSRGVVDAAPFSVDLVLTYKIHEVARNISDITLWLGPSSGVWIAESFWQKLSPAQQKLMDAVAQEAWARDMDLTLEAEAVARKDLLAKGVRFHAFPEAERTRWRKALPDFFGDFIAAQEKRGKGDDARRMISIWHDVVENAK